jgi:KaiC/GvpD/RAD55 family RecA-like ATPase
MDWFEKYAIRSEIIERTGKFDKLHTASINLVLDKFGFDEDSFWNDKLAVDDFKKIRDEVKSLTEDDIRKYMEEKIKNAIKKKGEDWVVASLVEGSIGYHTPKHARNIINRFLEGHREDYCERCIAIFNCELDTMLYMD